VIVNDLKLRLGKGGRHLILDNLDLDRVAHGDAGGVLERVAAADVDAMLA